MVNAVFDIKIVKTCVFVLKKYSNLGHDLSSYHVEVSQKSYQLGNNDLQLDQNYFIVSFSTII